MCARLTNHAPKTFSHYQHKTSHNLRWWTTGMGLMQSFRLPRSQGLSALAPINEMRDQDVRGTTFDPLPNILWVMYTHLPLPCKAQVGQKGCCINANMLEYANTLRNTPSGRLKVHCSRYYIALALGSLSAEIKFKKTPTRDLLYSFIIFDFYTRRAVH